MRAIELALPVATENNHLVLASPLSRTFGEARPPCDLLTYANVIFPSRPIAKLDGYAVSRGASHLTQ